MNKKSEETLCDQLEAAERFEADFPEAKGVMKEGPSLMDELADAKPGEVIEVQGHRFPNLIHADNRKEANPEAFGSHTPMRDHEAGGSNVKQYGLPKGAIELQDLIEYRGMNFAQGNIFKAQYRAGHCSHSDELRDARKTLWFAQREVERLSNG